MDKAALLALADRVEAHHIFWAYVIITILCAVAQGAVWDIEEGEEGGAWMIALIWPLVLLAALAGMVAYGPFWIGKKLRALTAAALRAIAGGEDA